MPTIYHPSHLDSWLLFATDDTVLYLEATVSISTEELWSALLGEAGVQGVLDILTRGGLSSTPSFALARFAPEGAHTLVRGALTLEVTGASDAQAIDGSGVSTWRETTVPGAVSVGTAMTSAALPLGHGVVHASGFSFAPAGAASPAQVASSPPVAGAPVPAPAAAELPAPEPAAAVLAEAVPTAPEPPAVVPLPAAASSSAESLSEHTMIENTMIERPDDDVAAAPEPVETAPAASAAPAAPGGEASFAHLFEETVYRSIEDAAVREAEPDEDAGPAATANPTAAKPAPPAPEEVLGDHDGETIMSGDIAALRARKRPTAPSAASPAARTIVLELPGNVREVLVQPIVIGRSPSASQVSGSEMPRLVTIPGNQDISRSHARFALEGDTVVVTDLHSRNGTTITLPGKPPQTLRKGEPTAVLPDTVVDLGGGVTLVVRES